MLDTLYLNLEYRDKWYTNRTALDNTRISYGQFESSMTRNFAAGVDIF